MKQFRILICICLALILCASLCLTALSVSVFLTSDRDVVFSTPAMCEAVFENILSGEDPALVRELETIPEFSAAQSRYVTMLAAWRYAGGVPWDGLTKQEASAIALRLLENRLQAQDPSYAQLEDYEQTLAQLSIPLQAALQDVFPPFDLVMHGTLRLYMDFAAALIGGSAAAASVLCTLVCIALMLLISPNKSCTVRIFSTPAAIGMVICILCGISFLREGLLLQFDSPLRLLRNLPITCAIVLFCFAGLYLVVLFVLSLVESIVVVPIKEQAPAAPPAEKAQQTQEVPADPTPIDQVQMEEQPKSEPIAESEPTDEASMQPLFAGASQYDLDMEHTADSNMDALLAQAAGPLFADASQISNIDFMENAEYLADLQTLFEEHAEPANAE